LIGELSPALGLLFFGKKSTKLEEQNAGARDGKKGDSTSSHNEERVFLPDHRLLVLLSSASASDQHLAPPTTVLPTPSAPSISPSCFAEVEHRR
jgi:hypothetical protein